MPAISKHQTPSKRALGRRAAMKGSLKRKPLSCGPLPRLKMGGKLPSRLSEIEIPKSKTKYKRNAKPIDLWPERCCQGPTETPELKSPVFVMDSQFKLPGLNKEIEPEISPRTRAPPPQGLPKIYLGDDSPTPHWLIRPAGLEVAQLISPRSSVSSFSRLPPSGRLRWEFDPGSPSQHGQDEKWLCKYAHRYLEDTLCDQIIRDKLREMIWNSRYAATVAHVEDPLPIPPPPPHFKDQRPSDFADLRPPISSAPEDYHFMYTASEWPSQQSKRMYGVP